MEHVHLDDHKYVQSVPHAGGRILLLIKPRTGLVVARAKRRVCEGPIFSHHDRELLEAKKDPDVHHEYVGLCPAGVDLADFHNQVPENPVARVDRVHKDGDLSSRNQFICVSMLEWRDVDTDDVQKIGNAYLDDVDDVVEVARKFLGYMPPADKMI